MAENIVTGIHDSASNNVGEAFAKIRNVAQNIELEILDLDTAVSLINDVLNTMTCRDNDDIRLQSKLYYLLNGLPNNVRAIQQETERLRDVGKMLRSEAT